MKALLMIALTAALVPAQVKAQEVVGVAPGGNTNQAIRWYTAYSDGRIYDWQCNLIVIAPVPILGFTGNVASNAVCIAWDQHTLYFFNLLTSSPYNGSCPAPYSVPIREVAIVLTNNGITFVVLYEDGSVHEGVTNNIGQSCSVFGTPIPPCDQPAPILPITWSELKAGRPNN